MPRVPDVLPRFDAPRPEDVPPDDAPSPDDALPAADHGARACPAELPAEVSRCTLSDPLFCMYTQPCGGPTSIRVWAYCMDYRDDRVWLHRFPDGLCDGGR